jgi:hypothetical protein
LGEPRAAAAATYSGGGAGVRGRHGCTGRPRGRVATAAMTGARGLWPFDASKRGKREDDDDDVSMTQSGPHLAVTPGGSR